MNKRERVCEREKMRSSRILIETTQLGSRLQRVHSSSRGLCSRPVGCVIPTSAMLPSTLFALLALTCQAIVVVSAAVLPREHRHKLRHQHGHGGKRENRQDDGGKYYALEQLLKAALKLDQEDISGDLIQNAMTHKFSRRNRSLDSGVLEQQSCQHEDLISCEEYSTGEKECHVTATGMSCCRCKGHLLRRRRRTTPFS